MVANTLNKALVELEELLARCERGVSSRDLADTVGCILERIEAAHSEVIRLDSAHKRTAELYKLENQRADRLQYLLDVASKKNGQPPVWIGPFSECGTALKA